METIQDAQQSTLPETPSTERKHPQQSQRTLLFTLAGILAFLIVGSFAYYLGTKQSNQVMPTVQVVSPAQPTPTMTQGVTPSLETVTYGYDNNRLVMRYKNSVYFYDEATKTISEPKPAADYAQVAWVNLFETPKRAIKTAEQSRGRQFFDEIFDIKPLANKDFLFIMRWDILDDKDTSQWEFPLYYYHAATKQVELLETYTWPDTKENPVPRLSELSPDQKKIALHMFGCWNCGAGHPETMLMNLTTKATKRIGKVSEFTWKDNTSYTYKVYKEIPCPSTGQPQGPNPCVEDPDKLPLQTGTF